MDDVSLGRELFARKWLPHDPRCHGGDGLGPVYNATSCLQCHCQGGPGGGGPSSQNVELATGIGYSFCPADDSRHKKVMGRVMPTDLVKFHPGFQNARSVVLHRYGVDPEYSRWRNHFVEHARDPGLLIPGGEETCAVEMQFRRQPGRFAGLQLPPPGPRVVQLPSMASVVMGGTRDGRVAERVQFSISKRNPPALFGAGLIDALPDEALYEVAQAQPPAVRGRVHRMKTGQAGRFGWKAQVASLKDFVMSACASELGLENPGHHQADSPLDPDAMAEARVGARENVTKQINIALTELTRGIRPIPPATPFKPNGRALDLTQHECDALTAYVADLPAPIPLRPSSARQSRNAQGGERIFGSIGCAVCHRPDLGEIRNIYSDLLLHDMGARLSDVGGYYNDSEDPDSPDSPTVSEWRTPPLWGIRDSGPYLHDGRAATLRDAIEQHGGQAAQSLRRFRALRAGEQSDLLAFLNSLAAPCSTPDSPKPPAALPKLVAARTGDIGDAISRATAKLHSAQILDRFGRTSEALDRYLEAVQEAPDSRAGRTAAERIRILEGR